MKHHTIAVCALVVSASMVQACSGGERGPQATAQALADTINQTATASGQQVDASGSLQTAEAEATARSEGLDATQAAQVAQTAEAAEATATGLTRQKGSRVGFTPRLRLLRTGLIKPKAQIDSWLPL